MSHKITIEIESEKEWAAICAVSSLLEKPVSELSKSDILSGVKNIARGLTKDETLMAALEMEQPENVKRLLAILK